MNVLVPILKNYAQIRSNKMDDLKEVYHSDDITFCRNPNCTIFTKCRRGDEPRNAWYSSFAIFGGKVTRPADCDMYMRKNKE